MTQGDPFKAVADPTRRAILDRLRQSPASVGELTDGLPISQSAVSQQLSVLRAAGLVNQQREGTRRIYSVVDDGFAPVRDWIDQHDGVEKAVQPAPAPLVLDNPLPETAPEPPKEPAKPRGLTGLDRLAIQQGIGRESKRD